MLVQTRFVSGGFVLVNQTFADRLVQRGRCNQVSLPGLILVTTGDGGLYLLDRCAHGRTLAGVQLVPVLSLSGAFACLGGIGHVVTPLVNLQQAGYYDRFSVASQRCIGF